MSRLIAGLAIAAAFHWATPGDVRAEPGSAVSTSASSADDPATASPSGGTSVGARVPLESATDVEQAIGGSFGAAGGGRVTPGGLRITGDYLYQLSASDWFDGAAVFTFGSGRGGCFRDRLDAVICDHGLTDGTGLELTAGIRRMFASEGKNGGQLQPYARVALGLAVVRFGDDDVSGFVVPVHVGGGIRARVAPSVSLVASGDLVVGIGAFNRGLGLEPQLGLAINAGAEFRLR